MSRYSIIAVLCGIVTLNPAIFIDFKEIIALASSSFGHAVRYVRVVKSQTIECCIVQCGRQRVINRVPNDAVGVMSFFHHIFTVFLIRPSHNFLMKRIFLWTNLVIARCTCKSCK